MRTLGDLIERFTKSLKTDIFLKEEVQQILHDVVGITISTDNIGLSDGILKIKTSPTVKNEIHLKEEKILESFKQKRISIVKITYS